MKHERLYRLLAWSVTKTLPRLNFDIAWQEDFGHGLLRFLNALGARLIYENLVSQ